MTVTGSWSYSGDPELTTKDAVRFLIGDTDEDDQQVSDEEIAYLLTQTGDSASLAAVTAAGALASKFSRMSVKEKDVGDLKIVYADRAAAYRQIAADITTTLGGSGAAPIAYAGGISISDMELHEGNTDRVPPSFEIGMDDRVDEPSRVHNW